jgi:hypothetical protein
VRYLVLIAYAPGGWEDADADERQAYFDAHHAFEKFVDGHGRRLSSGALAGPDLATTIRHGDDGPVVTDGPFAELVEQVGGWYDVELPDLDTAIAAGSLLHPSYTVEIRPVVAVEGYESV